MTTGAEGGVDRLIWSSFFSEAMTGTIVEVGAAGPSYLSISAMYRGLGWKVIAIEPNPEFCDAHRRRHYEIFQYACADYDKDAVVFQVVDSHGADYEGGKVSFESFSSLGIKENFATLKPNLDVKSVLVNVRRLDTILATHAPELREIDILSIDVEGWEIEVLKGFDIGRYSPKVMVIENLFDSPNYREFVRGKGYVLWKRVGLNEIYVLERILRPAQRLSALAEQCLRRPYREFRRRVGRVARYCRGTTPLQSK